MASLRFLAQEKYETQITVFLDCSNTLFSYLRGVMIDSIIVTIAVTIGLWFLGVPSSFLFGVIAGIFNVIPYVGPILGGIPIFIVSLSVGIHTFFWSLLVVFGTQFIDGNFIQPKIMSKAMNVHPVSIIVGLIIFGELFGFLGLVISTPLIGVINVLLKHSKHEIKL
jgi:predicted PurR-regulated permease PerM